MRLQNKTAVVTGAASGIGRAAALRLAQEGARIYAVDIDETGLAGTAQPARDAILTRRCDVADEQQVRNAVADAMEQLGRIDILVNIAGIQITKLLRDTTWADFTRMMEINMGGAFLFCREVLPHMQAQKSGSVINLASELAFVGYPKLASYTATKGAMVAFTRSVALEAIRDGVRVNCVCPGATDTPIFWEGEADLARRKAMLDQVAAEKPNGRLITPEEVANGILFMASDESSAVVGASLIMDGGFTAM
ncbi:MAG: SDR family oxidoreductase [Clostridiales bacterium]|jgi:NAD(P)-dependent dehydrogenase (short-subunit alcohol dehydrogenase family)|nr:SDR family oxidoreductase [Clostridiales bacterium]